MSTSPNPSETNAMLDRSWSSFLAHVQSASRIIERDANAAADPRLRASGYRYLLNLLNAGLEQELFSADPGYPEIGHLQDNTKRYGSESPDCLFGHCALDPSGTYRVTGVGGNPRYTGLTLYRNVRVYQGFDDTNPDQNIFAAATANTLGSVSDPGGLALDADGDFEIIISKEPHEGNWLPMHPEATALMTRQYFYDWETEEARHISIERLDPPGGGPVAEPATVSRQLERIGEFVDGFAGFWDYLTWSKRNNLPNKAFTRPSMSDTYAGDGGHIAYGGGHIELEPHQAAIIEVTPPECHFWNLHLADYWSQSLDYTFRQTSLNGHQAHLDEQGRFTAVVAHQDPGVANWLDTAGERYLPMTYRWWLCPTDDMPTPTIRIVDFADLDAHLGDSVRKVTPEERRRVLDGRRRAVLRRYQR